MIDEIAFKDIEDAAKRIEGVALRTPLIRFYYEEAGPDIYLKLENLQPIGSFKIRGAANAISHATADQLKDGVVTASAGNMAQGVAWNARRLKIGCTVVVPDHAPHAKQAAIARFGAQIIRVPFDDWWRAMETHLVPGVNGLFIHPVCNRDVIAGNGTIGLEILADLPDVDTILVPFGGGGLSCGIASAVKTINPKIKVIACEVETAAPLSASLEKGSPQTIVYTPSFVDGIGGKSIFPEMWSLITKLLDGSIVLSLKQVAEALALLMDRNHIIAEGAGAASVAAALSGKAPQGKIVCVVSGGNIDFERLVKIRNGEF